MAVPFWVEVLGPVCSLGVALITVVATRSKAEGTESTVVKSLSKDMETVKKVQSDQQSVLVTHTTLHSESGRDVQTLFDRVHKMEEKQNLALGRESARNHKQP